MTTNITNLKRDTAQIQALELAFECHSLEELGQRIGVHPDTIRNWLKQDDFFAARWNEKFEERITEAINMMNSRYPEVAEALIETALTGEKPGRVKAAQLITDILRKRQQRGRSMKLTFEITDED